MSRMLLCGGCCHSDGGGAGVFMFYARRGYHAQLVLHFWHPGLWCDRSGSVVTVCIFAVDCTFQYSCFLLKLDQEHMITSSSCVIRLISAFIERDSAEPSTVHQFWWLVQEYSTKKRLLFLTTLILLRSFFFRTTKYLSLTNLIINHLHHGSLDCISGITIYCCIHKKLRGLGQPSNQFTFFPNHSTRLFRIFANEKGSSRRSRNRSRCGKLT